MELLRKKDLHPKIGVAKSTVADWIEEFNIYIPQYKQGNVTYYRTEAIDVLIFIKHCRKQNYQKQQIMGALETQGFPINVEESNENITTTSNHSGQDNSNFSSVIQAMGQAVHKLSTQDESIKELRDKEREHEGRMKDIEKRTDQTNETVDDLKQEIQSLKEELAATREKTEKRSFWARLFKGEK